MMTRNAVIASERRLFDDFFKIDEVLVAHERFSGGMSATQRRLVFERGELDRSIAFEHRPQRGGSGRAIQSTRTGVAPPR
jgi:hypothetical protein